MIDWRSSVDAALEFARRNETLIEVIGFAFGFAESLAFLSFLVPGSILLVGLGAIAAASDVPMVPLLLASAAGAFLGDVVSFALGWRYRHEVRTRWPLRDHPEWLDRAKGLFDRWGAMTIIAGKAMGPLRPIIPLVGGAMHMPWPKFLPACVVSCLLWAATLLLPTYFGFKWAGW